MFKSFFPKPKLFFLSVLIWSIICISIWFSFNQSIGELFGLQVTGQEPVIGLGHFATDAFIFFTIYYIVCVALFAAAWFIFSPHKWQYWSILGSTFIMYSTYFSVQATVALNNFRKPFGDTLFKAFDPKADPPVTAQDLFEFTWIFSNIAFVLIAVFVITRFFVSHYIFRWRTAMNDYYTEHWQKLRKIEGASQRVQEDTMLFAKIVENLGVSIVDSVMTLIAFLPILWGLSSYITTLPIVGEIPAPLFQAAIFWSLFGTCLLYTSPSPRDS